MRLPLVLSFFVFGTIAMTMGWGNAVAQESAARSSVQPVSDIRIVGDGYRFTEGPAWDPKREVTFFTDIPNSAIHMLKSNGDRDVFTMDSAHANGLLVATDGRLLACQMDGQLVAYNIDDKTSKVLAAEFNQTRFNAPNDLILDTVGGIYFTDPLFRAPKPLPQKIQAVYYRSAAGKITRVTDHIAAPNGIALSPDGKLLYVAPTRQAEMLVFDILEPGKLSPAKTFCTLEQPAGQQNTGGDGMTVDIVGNLYFTTDLGVQIYSPAGEQIGLVPFPRKPANVTFAGRDRKTMIVTARSTVYAVEMPIAGLPPN